ncbi:MAG: IS21 family transposase [Chitinophagales bacterium]
MHQIRQILEHLSRGTGLNKTARLMGVSRNTIRDYRAKCDYTGLAPCDLLKLSDAELSALIRNKLAAKSNEDNKRLGDIGRRFEYFEEELSKTGVNKKLLWQEYLKDYPDGYRYTRFCHFLSQREKKNGAVMRLVHLPGEEMQVDFAGDKLSYIDTETGEVIVCEALVSVMPFSHYMHATALPSQKQDDFISGLVKALNYMKGVPRIVKCDNLKSAVIKPDRYTPEFTEAMEYFAQYYGITAMATRVAKPRDKASVEKAVDICYMRIYAPLRNQTFYSLNELNDAIAKQLEIHNNLLMQGKQYSRRQRFTEQEMDAMKPLPAQPYCIKRSTWSKVGKNYHVIVGEDRHSYSVSYTLIGRKMKLVYTSDYVEVYDGSDRVAVHKRSYRKYGYTTVKEHMPQNHQRAVQCGGYTSQDFVDEAKTIGANAIVVVEKMLKKVIYVQHTYGMWQAFKRLNKTYGKQRLETACGKVADLESVTCRVIENILKNGLDKQTPTLFDKPSVGGMHKNVRGPSCYQ